MRDSEFNSFIIFLWTTVLICDSILYLSGSDPSWGLVFPPILCLLMELFDNYFH